MIEEENEDLKNIIDKINSEECWAKNNENYNRFNKIFNNFEKKNGKKSKTYEDIILENKKLTDDYNALMARDDHVVNENEKYKRRIRDLELIINIH